VRTPILIPGSAHRASKSNELMLGWRAAENLGLHAGDTLRVGDRTYRTIRVSGADLAQEENLPGYRRRQIGLVFQLHNLVPQLSAVQNVEVAMFGTHLSRRQRRDRARTLLADVDLAGLEARPPTKLSGGERQRVAIARTLANEPEVLLADEPTGSLDERSVDLILDLFARLRAERPGMTMIIVTHDARVAGTADRII